MYSMEIEFPRRIKGKLSVNRIRTQMYMEELKVEAIKTAGTIKIVQARYGDKRGKIG